MGIERALPLAFLGGMLTDPVVLRSQDGPTGMSPRGASSDLSASYPYEASLSSSSSPLFDSTPSRRNTSSLKWSKYGDEVLPLWVADMDFRSPKCIADALQARLDHGVFGYTVPSDKVEEEVVKYLARQHNFQVDPSWIVWVHGLVPALTVLAKMAGGDEPGSQAMVCTPIYPPFLWTPKTAGMNVIQVPMKYDSLHGRWAMDFERMRERVTAATKIFILCNPHNPLGRVFSLEELRELATFCKEHKLILCSDEIHCDLILEPSLKHLPLSALGDPDILQSSISLYAPSKTYNIPGLSCAYAVIPDAGLRARFKRAARGFVTEINSFGYEASWAAYKHGEPWRQELIKYLRGNRDFAEDYIRTRIPRLRLYPTLEATYLMWLDCTELVAQFPRGHAYREDPARFFRERARVGLSDGRDFGGPNHVRLNLGCSREMLHEALRRIEEASIQLDLETGDPDPS